MSGDGTKTWRDDAFRLHRDNGPAYVRGDDYKAWYIHGVRHREGGPAIERPDGRCEWYLNGRFIREEDPNDAT